MSLIQQNYSNKVLSSCQVKKGKNYEIYHSFGKNIKKG